MSKEKNRGVGEALATEMRAKAKELVDQAKALEDQARFARGTQRDVSGAVPARAPAHPRRGEYFVGDEGPTVELYETIRRMLTGQAKTFREIKDETGAGDNRIKGVIMRMQRDGLNVVNLGSDTRALWSILSPDALERIQKAMKEAKARKR